MIPVVFIHKGDGERYLECVLTQAKKFGNEVILIGDAENEKFRSIITHRKISNYNKLSNEFSKVYVPLSTYGDYELFCFQRWFILLEWMNAQSIETCLYLDSDVMFYANAEEEVKKFEQFDLTYIHRCVGCSSYWTYEGLRRFCEFTVETYAQKGFDYDRISAHFDVMQKHNMTGGVCDMTFLEYYARYKNPAGVGEMMYVYDGSTYDHCIHQQDHHYEMKNGIKNIRFVDGRPYCRQLSTGKMIRFSSLHFQGGFKKMIPQIFAAGNTESPPLASQSANREVKIV